ncbi:hypothetical protein RRG08_060791 [Elysia crispata]|uniref:Uncharacterized protein n=1 Tax=Elysia crispata TaxID=231223 RepID=A0AAE1E8J9_9GAST|nr:hypothetical protein RRG08_060791 [Elysia crispata]
MRPTGDHRPARGVRESNSPSDLVACRSNSRSNLLNGYKRRFSRGVEHLCNTREYLLYARELAGSSQLVALRLTPCLVCTHFRKETEVFPCLTLVLFLGNANLPSRENAVVISRAHFCCLWFDNKLLYLVLIESYQNIINFAFAGE